VPELFPRRASDLGRPEGPSCVRGHSRVLCTQHRHPQETRIKRGSPLDEHPQTPASIDLWRPSKWNGSCSQQRSLPSWKTLAHSTPRRFSGHDAHHHPSATMSSRGTAKSTGDLRSSRSQGTDHENIDWALASSSRHCHRVPGPPRARAETTVNQQITPTVTITLFPIPTERRPIPGALWSERTAIFGSPK
jgi:hypothetical protein